MTFNKFSENKKYISVNVKKSRDVSVNFKSAIVLLPYCLKNLKCKFSNSLAIRLGH